MSWSTNSAKIAAAFAGLGFKITTRETEIIELDRFTNLRFYVSETSLLRPTLPHRDDLYRGWIEGTLVKLDPTHPFLCGMHACHSMDALMDYQSTGTSYALQLVPGTPLYRYQTGAEDPHLKLAPVAHAIVDLPLAAAVSLAGLPVIDIEGSPPRRRYLLPNRTLSALLFSSSQSLPVSESPSLPVSDLLARKTPGKLPLQLGSTHPEHPVIQGYNATYAYARLFTEIKRLKKNLLVKDPYSDRRALVPENPSSQLEDEVRQHFRIPG